MAHPKKNSPSTRPPAPCQACIPHKIPTTIKDRRAPHARPRPLQRRTNPAQRAALPIASPIATAVVPPPHHRACTVTSCSTGNAHRGILHAVTITSPRIRRRPLPTLPLAPAASHCQLPLASTAGTVASSRCPPSAPSSPPHVARPASGCWPSSTAAASLPARSHPAPSPLTARSHPHPAPTDLISRCHSHPPSSSQLDAGAVRGYQRATFRPRGRYIGRRQMTWFVLSEYHFVWRPHSRSFLTTLTSSSTMFAVPSIQNADAGLALAAVACSRASPDCAST